MIDQTGLAGCISTPAFPLYDIGEGAANDLPDAMQAEFEAHIEKCQACAGEVSRLIELGVREMDIHEQLQRELQAEEKAEARRQSWDFRR